LTAGTISAGHRGEVKIRTTDNQRGGLEGKWTKVKALETYLALLRIQRIETFGKSKINLRTC